MLKGYSGKACALHIENNVGNEWHYLASAYSGLTPRAAHSAIYIKETDSLYVYGGYDLNNILGSLQVTWDFKFKLLHTLTGIFNSNLDISLQQEHMGR